MYVDGLAPSEKNSDWKEQSWDVGGGERKSRVVDKVLQER